MRRYGADSGAIGGGAGAHHQVSSHEDRYLELAINDHEQRVQRNTPAAADPVAQASGRPFDSSAAAHDLDLGDQDVDQSLAHSGREPVASVRSPQKVKRRPHNGYHTMLSTTELDEDVDVDDLELQSFSSMMNSRRPSEASVSVLSGSESFDLASVASSPQKGRRDSPLKRQQGGIRMLQKARNGTTSRARAGATLRYAPIVALRMILVFNFLVQITSHFIVPIALVMLLDSASLHLVALFALVTEAAGLCLFGLGRRIDAMNRLKAVRVLLVMFYTGFSLTLLLLIALYTVVSSDDIAIEPVLSSRAFVGLFIPMCGAGFLLKLGQYGLRRTLIEDWYFVVSNAEKGSADESAVFRGGRASKSHLHVRSLHMTTETGLTLIIGGSLHSFTPVHTMAALLPIFLALGAFSYYYLGGIYDSVLQLHALKESLTSRAPESQGCFPRKRTAAFKQTSAEGSPEKESRNVGGSDAGDELDHLPDGSSPECSPTQSRVYDDDNEEEEGEDEGEHVSLNLNLSDKRARGNSSSGRSPVANGASATNGRANSSSRLALPVGMRDRKDSGGEDSTVSHARRESESLSRCAAILSKDMRRVNASKTHPKFDGSPAERRQRQQRGVDGGLRVEHTRLEHVSLSPRGMNQVSYAPPFTFIGAWRCLYPEDVFTTILISALMRFTVLGPSVLMVALMQMMGVRPVVIGVWAASMGVSAFLGSFVATYGARRFGLVRMTRAITVGYFLWAVVVVSLFVALTNGTMAGMGCILGATFAMTGSLVGQKMIVELEAPPLFHDALNTMEHVLTSALLMVMYLSGYFFRYPSEFRYLAVLSFFGVTCASLMFLWWTRGSHHSEAGPGAAHVKLDETNLHLDPLPSGAHHSDGGSSPFANGHRLPSASNSSGGAHIVAPSPGTTDPSRSNFTAQLSTTATRRSSVSSSDSQDISDASSELSDIAGVSDHRAPDDAEENDHLEGEVSGGESDSKERGRGSEVNRMQDVDIVVTKGLESGGQESASADGHLDEIDAVLSESDSETEGIAMQC